MARPSEVVKLIDSLWKFPRDEQAHHAASPVELYLEHAPQVSLVFRKCEEIPDELLPSGQDRLAYDLAFSNIRTVLNRWDASDKYGKLVRIRLPDGRNLHPLTIVRMTLEQCADDPVAAAISELAFITDADVREDLGQDIEEAKRALANREWKSATVVAASVTEALLLWAIDQKPPADQTRAIQDAISKKKLSGQPDPSLDKWVLAQLIPVAAEPKLIEDDTEKQADLARDFRNYIHPGRVRRKGKKCDEATAHGARSAVLLLIRDLKKNFP